MRYWILIFMFFYCSYFFAQLIPDTASRSWINWTKENVKDLDLTNGNPDTNYLKSVLHGKNIVLLGEDSHGTAEFSLAKTDIIKFLHRSLHFDVVVFESHMGDCFVTNESIKEQEIAVSIKNALHYMWHTKELIPLFDYIKQSKSSSHPLSLAGSDAEPSSFVFSRYLLHIIKKTDEAYAKTVFSFDSLFVSDYKELIKPNSKSEIKQIRRELNKIRKKYKQLKKWVLKNIDLNEKDIVYRILNDRILMINYLLPGLHTNRLTAKTARLIASKIKKTKNRDALMCDNLEYLYKVFFPGKKLIVWAHNAHLNKSIKRMGGFPPLKPFTYSIGLFARCGKGAYNDRSFYELKSPDKNSLEDILGYGEKSVGFIDLSNQTKINGNSWMFNRIKFKYWDGSQKYESVIRDKFDGITLINKISPPHYLD